MGLHKSSTSRTWWNLVTSEAFRSNCSQMFYEIGGLEVLHNPQENTCVGVTF